MHEVLNHDILVYILMKFIVHIDYIANVFTFLNDSLTASLKFRHTPLLTHSPSSEIRVTSSHCGLDLLS